MPDRSEPAPAAGRSRLIWMLAVLAIAAVMFGVARQTLLRGRPLAGAVSLGRDWLSGGFIPGGTFPTTPASQLPAGLAQVGSWIDGDQWQGDASSAWLRAPSTPLRVFVAGYPQHAGCSLAAEFRRADGTVTVVKCTLPDPAEKWRPWDLSPVAGATSFRLIAADRATDPGGWLAFSQPKVLPPAALTIACTVALALTGAALAALLFVLLRPYFEQHLATATEDSDDEPPEARPSAASRALTIAAAAGLFLMVVGSKWWVIDRFGSDLPNWDQWDAEGSESLIPWFEHDHYARHLFAPHNEHRVVMTKLGNLALTLLAGQWDARLECVFNALLHSALAVAVWLAGRRWIRRAAQASSPATFGAGGTPALLQAALFIIVALVFALPLAWQNITGGFHSQQYWLLLLSFAAMVALPFARPWSAGWWAAALAAILALFTMGSGMLASAVVFAVVAWRCLRGDDSVRRAWPTLAVTLALTAIGLATRVERDFHAHMKAKDAHDFLYSMMHSMQWPVPDGHAWWAALVLWLPWAFVVWRALRNRGSRNRGALTIAALGGWVVLQLLATAYARGANGDYPAPRYMDTLAFGIIANALALGWLLSRNVARIVVVARAMFALAWLGVFAWGLWQATPALFARDLPDNAKYFRKAEAYVRAYLVTHDRADLAHDDIPYPSADSLIERLERPCLHARLPASVRPPLALTAAAAKSSPPTFAENLVTLRTAETDHHPPRRGYPPATPLFASHPTWGSFSATTGAAATGEWRSAPLTAKLGGWLKFETAGQLGLPSEASAKESVPGFSLELRDAATDALLASVRPTKTPGDGWRAAYVRAPRGLFVVVARDESTTGWLAFSAPVEMSNLSHAAWLLAKNGRLVTLCAAGACVLLGFASLLVGRARYP